MGTRQIEGPELDKLLQSMFEARWHSLDEEPGLVRDRRHGESPWGRGGGFHRPASVRLEIVNSATQSMESELGLTIAAYAAPIGDGCGVGFNEDVLVAPASVLKVPVALTVESTVSLGELNPQERRVVPSGPRTPGPVGLSLMTDVVEISVRDLVTTMLTVSDNVATDELIAIVGIERINQTVDNLGLRSWAVTSDIRTMLDDVAHSVGFGDYLSLVRHRPDVNGAPDEEELMRRIRSSPALDPTQGTRTTARDAVELLKGIWTDRAGPPVACERIRWAMERQLVRARLASGFGQDVSVAAKSGGLLGVVPNEIGVVRYPSGDAYAVAVFTRRGDGISADPRNVDRAIGAVAHILVDEIRLTRSS